MIDAVTTNAAATIMRRDKDEDELSSGDIFPVVLDKRRRRTHTTGFAVLDDRRCQYRKAISIWGNGSWLQCAVAHKARTTPIVRLRSSPHIRCIETETFGPFSMV